MWEGRAGASWGLRPQHEKDLSAAPLQFGDSLLCVAVPRMLRTVPVTLGHTNHRGS
jgi:hypothetical protein